MESNNLSTNFSPHSAPWAKQKGGPELVGRTGSPWSMPQATPSTVAQPTLAKSARAAQHPARAALRGSAPEPAPTSAAAAVGQARRDGAPAAAALPARPGATLNNLPRLTGLLSGRSTPKSCTTCCSSAPNLSTADMQKFCRSQTRGCAPDPGWHVALAVVGSVLSEYS